MSISLIGAQMRAVGELAANWHGDAGDAARARAYRDTQRQHQGSRRLGDQRQTSAAGHRYTTLRSPSDLKEVLLPGMNVLHYQPDVLCGVDDSGITACRVGDHGFVLSPTSTTLF